MSAAGRIIQLIGIGTTAGDRVWRLKAKDSTQTPFAIVQTVVETPINSHDDTSELSQAIVQISCYGISQTAAAGLADSIRALIEGNHTEGPVSIASIRESFEEDPRPGLYRTDIDASVWTNAA